jgi:Carbohydrate binding domain
MRHYYMKKSDMFHFIFILNFWLHLGFSSHSLPTKLHQEDKIHFNNPSFEGKAGASQTPQGWYSYTNSSTPDLLPGAWGVQAPAYAGNTCLGLVTREDGTSEDVGQLLSKTLQMGTCYTFSMYLNFAPKYVGYNNPIRLRVWGGTEKGEKATLLTSSPLIDNQTWKEYKFQFVPKSNIRYLTFEAYFGPGVTFFYKGNILLDNVSPIERCDRA